MEQTMESFASFDPADNGGLDTSTLDVGGATGGSPEVLPAHLRQHIEALFTAGHSLLPMKSGGNGKQPAINMRGVRRPLDLVITKMVDQRSRCYGIRLPNLVVLDLDEDDPALVKTLEDRFGPAAVQVQTARGRHLYYRYTGGALPNLQKEGLMVDVKHGPNAYVLGPYSVRPDGVTYRYIQGDLLTTVLHPFPATAHGAQAMLHPPATQAATIPVGQRHNALLRGFAVKRAASCNSEADLFRKLTAHKDQTVQNPQDVDPEELLGIAKWAWDLHTHGRLHQQTGGSRTVHPSEFLPDSPDANHLYAFLRLNHGGQKDRAFALQPDKMVKEGFPMSERAFVRARSRLLKAGLIEVAKPYVIGKSLTLYRLCRIR